MLILKEPIKLKSLSPMVRPSDGFFERMDANYKQLQAKYSAEELFHLLNQSPEIYIEDGGMTTIVTQNKNELNQKVRLEMVYNLFNRLMMSDSSDFTYQDTVFVQNMLEKLGVRNVSEFMKQLYEFQQDTKNTKQLLNIYRNHTETLGMIIESVNVQEKKEDNRDNSTFPAYWIHNEIFKRLQTGNVYHTVAAFQKDEVHHQNSISAGEVELARQIHTSETLKIQSLENRILMSEKSLLEHRVNIYEEGTGEESYEKEQIIQELAQAVLLNIAGNLYQSGSERPGAGKNTWYRFEGEFHQILEDTFQRFSKYRFQDIHYAGHSDRSLYQHNVNELREEKIEKLHKILEISERADIKNIASEEKFTNIESLTAREQLSDREAYTEIEKLLNEEHLLSEEQMSELEELVHKEHLPERVQRITADEELRILNEINAANKRLEHDTESLEKDREQEQRLTEEIRLLNEENRRRMEETEKKEEVYKKILPVQIDKKRTRRETLLLLSHPELFEQYTEETDVSLPVTENKLKEIETEITRKIKTESASQIENLEREKERLLREYRESITQTGESIRRHRSEDVREYLTEETRQHLTGKVRRHLAEEVRKYPEMRGAVLTYLDTVSKEKIEESYQNSSYTAPKYQTETIQKELRKKETVEQVKKKGQLHVLRQQQYEQQPMITNRSVQFYHKEPDSFIKEIPEGLVSHTSPTEKTEVTDGETMTTMTRKIVTNQQIHKQTNNLVKKDSEHITELINKGVQRQLNTISDQVYHKLEKRLSNDRKRRGY